MLKGIGYKNERLLSFSADVLIVSLVSLITFLAFKFPHYFSYFEELEKAAEEIDPAKYVQIVQEIHSRFERTILEFGFLYWMYESAALILFGQTIGKKIFGRKLVFLYEGPGKKILRFFVILTRTLLKVMCIYWMIPVFILGIQFLLSKKNKTLLDRIFLTQIEEEE